MSAKNFVALVLAFVAITISGAGARAATDVVRLQFQPTVTVWTCPPNATAILLQCQPDEHDVPLVTLTLPKVLDALYQGEWTQQVSVASTTPSPSSVTFDLLATQFVEDDGSTNIMIDASAGWASDVSLNADLFLSTRIDRLPEQLMLTGDRKPQGDHELVLTFELVNLKML